MVVSWSLVSGQKAQEELSWSMAMLETSILVGSQRRRPIAVVIVVVSRQEKRLVGHGSHQESSWWSLVSED